MIFSVFRKRPLAGEVVQNWRAGMWVIHEDKIGILSKLDPAEVHLVNELGETYAVVPAVLSGLRQATRLEIPEPRRPTREKAMELGYGT